MNTRTTVSIAVLLAILLSAGSLCAQQESLSHRWLFVMRNLSNEAEVDSTIALFPRASAAGYNAVVLSDSTLHRLDEGREGYDRNLPRLRAAAERYGLELIPVVMPMGYAGGLMVHNRNLAEGLPVRDALYVAGGGVARLVPDPPVSLQGGDFETGDCDRFGGWGIQDGRGKSLFPSADIVHSGDMALHMTTAEDHEAAVRQQVEVHPFRQYHVSVWIKTRDFDRPRRARLRITAEGEEPQNLNHTRLQIEPNQDWTQHHVIFNSFQHDSVSIGLLVSRQGPGDIYWDDLRLEEVGPVNLLRRSGCPVVVRGEDGTVYEEGRDFQPLHDPLLDPYEIYHEPPVIHLTPTSRIAEGARLRVSYYHSVRINVDQVVGCLSDPAVYDVLRAQVRRVDELLHPATFFMNHDEIRIANWCQACRSRGLTPGELLADNVSRCVQMIREVRPDAQIWVWSDMFDPWHNAGEGRYFVDGSWEGSWEGLESSVGIVNWASFSRGRNFDWFGERGHQQILAGYYDRDREGEGIRRWLAGAVDTPSVVGAMYTTWEDRYDDLEAWAAVAWGEESGPPVGEESEAP